MNSKQNTYRQKQNKNVSKTIFTARNERSDVEIQKHFKSSKSNRDEINKGVDSFPIVGDVEFESNVEVSLNIDKPNKITKKSFVVSNPTEISLDVVLPNEIDANFEFFGNNNDFNTCTSLNKKVEDINKQLADLEKDIQFNFYDPKTKVGSNLKKYSSHLPSFSSSKNPSNTTTSTASDFGNVNKFNNAPKESDATIELKNEIYSYRNSLKQKQFEENIEKRLSQLHKQKEQSELRKNEKNETKVEVGHEPTCPFSLKIDLPEPVLKIHEMQLTAKRLKFVDGDGALNSPHTQNASSSQTPRKTDQTTIQVKEPKQEEESKPSTSKSNDTQTSTTLNNENDLPISISGVEVGVVQQLNSLLEKSTNELDDLKSLLRKYLETEKNNKSPRSEKNVKFSLNTNSNTRKKHKPPSHSSSNSDVSIASQNIENRKKLPKEPPKTRPTMGVEKKTKVIKIKQISKSTKSTKCGLSDISESNELEGNSSSSDVIKSKATPVKKQNSKKENCECKPTVTSDKQTEFMLNIVSKSSSSLLSSDEDKLTHIRDFIQKPPKDSNDLTNPPNTDRLPPPSEKKAIDKKKFLEVQMLPPLDIKRSLTTQKLPAVAIESTESFADPNKMSSENVKYIQITHGTAEDLPKEQTTTTVKSPDKVKCNTDNTKICTKICSTQEVCPVKTETTDIKIEEIYIAQQQLLSSCDDIITEKTAVANNEKPKDVPKQRGTVSEELNLDIDSLPSVRTLKEIQNYLEQKCALIRSRLEEESKLKPGETLSLRYKLSEPPRWQSSNPSSGSKAEPESKNTIPPEQTPKQITLSPLKTYSSIKSPLSPLQKHDKSQQINSRLVCKPNLIKNPLKTVDKSLQVSISEDTELPVARKDNAGGTSQLSVQTSNKDVHETQEGFNTPPFTFPKTVNPNENSDSIREITVSPQKDNFKAVCIPCKDAVMSISSSESLKESNNPLLIVSREDQVTNKALMDDNKFSNISTQVDEFDYVEYPAKHVSFETVTRQYSIIPNENKETQISQSDLPEEMTTKTPRDEKKKEKVEKKQCRNEKTQTTKNETPIVFCMQSNATQTINVKDKLTVCNISGLVEKDEEFQMKPSSIIKETKECCTQYSPVLEQQDLDATEYKKINSFRKVDSSEYEEQYKRVHYPPVELRNYYKSTMRNKRPLQRHKMCSTPVSPSSISTTTETISLSDGEVKLSCECSTSIGEIHLCRFANSIRKKVKILKQNPEEILKESFGGASSFKMTRQHKYNDNWFAYYVTKTESSSEQGTGSNLSSIKSNIETE